MKIIIAGAGEMGSHLAKMLSGNGHDITVIDSDQKLLADVGNLADVITVEGDSTTFAVLRRASVRKCDLFIAVNHEENDNVVHSSEDTNVSFETGFRSITIPIELVDAIEPFV